jgi:putative membrane protein
MSADPKAQDSIDDERVREHLANERTYLAWLRTGMATIGLGVVIAKLRFILGSHDTNQSILYAANVGMVLVLCGILTIILALYAFMRVRREIRERQYKSRVRMVLSLAAVMMALGFLMLWYLVQQPTLP